MTLSADFHLEWKPASGSDAPTAVVRTAAGPAWWLHSRVDPLEEAQFLIDDTPVHPRALYVVLGFGLGYHVKALLDRLPPQAHVMVIEPDQGTLSTLARQHAPLHLGAWMQSPRLHLLVCRDPAVLPLRLAASFSAYDALSLQMIPHLPSMRLAPDFYQSVITVVREQLPGAAAAHLTALESLLDHELGNYWANLAGTWRGGDIDALRHVCRDRPVVIVSAGPSLSAALPVLKALQGRALLMATAPTVTLLLAEGIRPDVVVSVDPFPENLAHFVPWLGTELPLVYYQRVFHRIVERYRGPMCAFSMRDEPPLPLKADSRPALFFPGGTVAFSALQLAHHLGGNPVVFVGQDFAFADGRTHAAGVDYGREVGTAPGGQPLLEVPGVLGVPVLTNGLYYSYLLHMQEYLLAYQRQRPDVRHLNASSGAVILGTEHVPFERLLTMLQPVSAPAPGECVRAAIGEGRRAMDDVAAARLVRTWRTALSRVLVEAETGTPFESLFETFRSTAIHTHLAASYDRIRYVYDSRYAPRGDAAAEAFRARFVTHLRFVAETFDRLAAGDPA